MTNLSFSVPDSIAGLFGKVCLESKRVQEEVLRELVVKYLEDIEDYQAIIESENSAYAVYSLADVRAEFGV